VTDQPGKKPAVERIADDVAAIRTAAVFMAFTLAVIVFGGLMFWIIQMES
jgi:hypothetical protein